MRPANPLRVALLGAGAWARVLARSANGSRAIEFAQVWSPTSEHLLAFAAETGIEPAARLEDVWRDDAIEAVAIALPNDVHLEFAELAARHGKHAFIEKPIAHTLADGVRIAALENVYGIRVVVGHCARLLTGNQLMREALRRGELGTVSQIEANFSNDRAARLTPRDWRWYSSKSPGGPLSQIAIHQFDVLRALGGDLAGVSARCGRHSRAGAEVEDQWIVSVEFADGKLGSVVSSWTSPGTYSVRVTGAEALMFYEVDQTLWSTPERLHEGAVLYRQSRSVGPGERQAITVPPGNMFREELQIFADAVRNSSEVSLSCDNACQALAAVEAAIASAHRNGEIVALAEILDRAHERQHDRETA